MLCRKTFFIITSVIVIVISFSSKVSAQKVLQCAPGMATINNDLKVIGDLTVNNNAIVSNDLSVINGNLYLGPNGSKPYITDNAGSGILFFSRGGDNFLWQSPSGTNPDAMILRAGGGLPSNNGYNLQVFGQVSSYQMHAQGIHIDMQGGIGPVPRPNILKFTNSAATGTGAAIFLGNPGAYDDNSIIFSEYTAGNDIGKIMMAMNTASGNVGVRTANPQITLALGDNDTGLKWISDGNFQLVSNGTQELTIDPGNIRVRSNLCLGGVCKNAWPAENDPKIGTLINGQWCTNDGTQINCTSPAPVSTDSQTLSVTGFDLSISGGNTVNLPSYWTISGTDIYNNNVGNVGVGTVNPFAKLEVDMKNLTTTEGFHISRDAAASHYSYLNIEDESGNPILKVHESGKVGIGTATPTSKLHVFDGDFAVSGGYNYVANSALNSRPWYDRQGTPTPRCPCDTDYASNCGGNFDSLSDLGARCYDYDGSGPTTYNVYDRSASLGYTSFYVSPVGGNVGVGTNIPSEKLEVAGTIYSTSGGIKFPDGTTQVTAAINNGILGSVKTDGSRISGTGFNSSVSGGNVYTITFTTPFSTAPIILITPDGIPVIAGVSNVSVNSFDVRFVDRGNSGNLQTNFYFSAMKP